MRRLVLVAILTVGCAGKLPPETEEFLRCVAECSYPCIVMSCVPGVPISIEKAVEAMPPVLVCTEDGECVEVK